MSTQDIEDLDLHHGIDNLDEHGSVKYSNSGIQVNKDAKGLPESYKLWIKTFGCAHNMSDGEYMEGILASYGYRFTLNCKDADLWILNSCTVKDPSEQAFRNLVNDGLKLNKKVVVAGCVPQADRSLKGLDKVSIIGVNQIHRIVEVVEETLNGNRVIMLKQKDMPPLDMPKIRKDHDIEIVPLSIGCLGNCTYCKTRYARGKLQSYSIQQICDRIQNCMDEGVHEIWLSSEDTGAYGRDINLKLQDLLKKIQEMPKHTCMYRIGMTNPPYILDSLPAVAEFLKQPYVYSFIHVPVQSGSNKVLGEMRRQYTREDYIQVCDYLFEHVPGITIATDIIVGYSTETEDDFQETMSLLYKYDQPIVNISRFFPRPGTPAATLPRTPSKVMKHRSHIISDWFKHRHPYKDYLDRIERVWVGNEREGDYSVAHTKGYVKVLIPYDETLLGTCILVRIINTFRFHIVGRIICRHPEPLTVLCSPSDYDLLIPKTYDIHEEISPLEESMNTKKEHEHTGFSDEENDESVSSAEIQTINTESEQEQWNKTADHSVNYNDLSEKERNLLNKYMKPCHCGANPGGLCIGACQEQHANNTSNENYEERICQCDKNPGGLCTCNHENINEINTHTCQNHECHCNQ